MSGGFVPLSDPSLQTPFEGAGLDPDDRKVNINAGAGCIVAEKIIVKKKLIIEDEIVNTLIETLVNKVNLQEAQIESLLGRNETTFAYLTSTVVTLVSTPSVNFQLTSADTPSFMDWGAITANDTGRINVAGTYCIGLGYFVQADDPVVLPNSFSANIIVLPAVGAPTVSTNKTQISVGQKLENTSFVVKVMLDESQVPANIRINIGIGTLGGVPDPGDTWRVVGGATGPTLSWVTKLL